jgi:hypothetical protein
MADKLYTLDSLPNTHTHIFARAFFFISLFFFNKNSKKKHTRCRLFFFFLLFGPHLALSHLPEGGAQKVKARALTAVFLFARTDDL